jgi:cystathionine gamma-synthase
VGGVVISKVDDDFFQRLRGVQIYGGAVPSPFDCWLVLRGIRTLPYRMRVHSENAAKVATFLSGHAQIELVHYPGLQDHPAHDLAPTRWNYSAEWYRCR